MKKYLLFFVLIFILFFLVSPSAGTPAQDERDGFRALGKAEAGRFAIPPDMARVKQWRQENRGITVKRYQQYFQGALVLGGQLTIRKNSEGRTLSVTGAHYADRIPQNTVKLTEEQAVKTIVSLVGDDGGQWPVTLMFDPIKEKFFYKVEKPRIGSYWVYWVDAETGDVLNQYDSVPTGWGYGVLEDEKDLTGLTTWNGARYEMISQNGRIKTYNAQNSPEKDTLPGIIAKYPSDTWTYVTPDRTSPGHPAMVDGQFYANWVDIYFDQAHGTDWLTLYPDGMKISVHFDVNLNGAFWDIASETAVFGDGDGSILLECSGGLEVVGHELTHGITNATSDLNYQNESGALSESFSDILGTSLEFYYKDQLPVEPVQQVPDWTIGEDIGIGGYLKRNMAEPNDIIDDWGNPHPSHYRDILRGSNDYGYVHSNAGIINHWFYLLVSGVTPRLNFNDNPDRRGDGVMSIGEANIQDAAEIVFNTFTALNSTACICDARDATIAEAQGYAGGIYETPVTDAWDEVGVSQQLCAGPNVVIEYPTEGQVVSGPMVPLTGWTTDLGGVYWIEYKYKPVGGTFQFLPVQNGGYPGYGVQRTDICPPDPGLDDDPNCPNVGFEVTFDSHTFTDGDYVLAVIVTDYQGNTVNLWRTITVDNSTTTYEEIAPDDDGWVDETLSYPVSCSTDLLKVQNINQPGNRKIAYLKFTVPDVPGTKITGAALRVACTHDSPEALEFLAVDNNNWTECDLTWANRPQGDETFLYSFSSVGYGFWTVDILDFIAANGPGTYTFKITDPSGNSPGELFSSRFSNSNLHPKLILARSPLQPSITVTSPNGGENWKPGDTEDISWNAQDISGPVKIVLRKGGSYLGQIATGLDPDLGSYPWTVGQYSGGIADPGDDYTIRVREIGTSNWDDSDAPFTITGIKVISPNGGEEWEGGTPQQVTWISAGSTANVAVEFSEDAGTTWITLVDSTPNDGSADIIAPMAESSQCLIRISEVGGTASDDSDAVFTISMPHSIMVTLPNGGEILEVGTIIPITWTSTGGFDNVKIESSINNGGLWDPVINSTPNDGSYDWEVPNTPSTTCLIRISEVGGTASDVSDGVFTILLPSLTVTSPNGGESLVVDTTIPIIWTSTGSIDNVKIEYSINSGGIWNPVINSTPNDGSYDWVVPNTPSTTCLVRISEVGGTASDVSDGVFTILLPYITVTSPNGGETWQVGSTRTITWTSTGIGDYVTISYSTREMGIEYLIDDQVPNDGSYNWTIPNTPSNDCRVRISESGGSVADVSDAPFSIVLPPSITVTSPNGREAWQGGSQQTITWTSTGTISTVLISFSLDNGATWEEIASTPNTGSYRWTLPRVEETVYTCLVKVEASFMNVSDTSDAPFAILAQGEER